jgi:hypothetical protein
MTKTSTIKKRAMEKSDKTTILFCVDTVETEERMANV